MSKDKHDESETNGVRRMGSGLRYLRFFPALSYHIVFHLAKFGFASVESGIVQVTNEISATIIAPRDNMIKSSLGLQSWFACHACHIEQSE